VVSEEMQTFQALVEAFDEAVAEELGISGTDLRCLELLIRQGPVSPGVLATALGLTSGGVTAMLIRLEAKHYVRRTPDPADGRRVTVEVTAAVRRRTLDYYLPFATEGEALLSDYTIAELRLLADFLRGAREMYERQLEQLRTPVTPARARSSRGRRPR
jgi:DNA-binding MarR family transcriptional regulator